VTGTAKRSECVVDTSSYIYINVNLNVSDLGTAVSWQSTVLVYANNHISDNQNSHTAPLCSTISSTANGILLLEQNSEVLPFICYHTVPAQSGGISIIFYKKEKLSIEVNIYMCATVLSFHCHNLASLLYPHISSKNCHTQTLNHLE